MKVLFVCLLFLAVPMACGSSWARDGTCATAATQNCCINNARFLIAEPPGNSSMKFFIWKYMKYFFFFVFLGPISQPQHCQIWAVSATYTRAHGNAGSLTHWVGPGIEPVSLWILVRFITAEPQWELLKYDFVKDVICQIKKVLCYLSGVPVMVQRKWIRLGTMRLQVQSLASEPWGCGFDPWPRSVG